MPSLARFDGRGVEHVIVQMRFKRKIEDESEGRIRTGMLCRGH